MTEPFSLSVATVFGPLSSVDILVQAGHMCFLWCVGSGVRLLN